MLDGKKSLLRRKKLMTFSKTEKHQSIMNYYIMNLLSFAMEEILPPCLFIERVCYMR